LYSDVEYALHDIKKREHYLRRRVENENDLLIIVDTLLDEIKRTQNMQDIVNSRLDIFYEDFFAHVNTLEDTIIQQLDDSRELEKDTILKELREFNYFVEWIQNKELWEIK